MSVQFRQLQDSFVAEVLKMMNEFNAIYGYPFDEALRRENLEKIIANQELGRLWLVIENEEVLGYVFVGFGFSFEFKGRDAFVDELYIRPAFQGKGIGGMAIDYITKESKSLGIRALHLEVERENLRALGLYSRKGFKDHNRYLMTRFI